MTPELFNMVRSCGTYKHVNPYQKMLELYDIFSKNGLRSRVLKEIKKNLID
jgi:hypothetical protein